jgi:Vitamin K-dependent gamma-carboxylase
MKSRIYSFFNQYVFEVFSLDLRSLALFRICLGLILIADLIVRAEHLEDYYTDLGVLPRSFLIDNYLHPCQWSFHLLSGETLIQIILFGVAILFALALIMGYQTRMVTIISWVFLVSLQNRNLMVNDHGDLVLRLLLFWSIFLPLGAKFSVDEIKKGKSFETEFFSVGTMALILQICFIYWFTVLWKSSAPWTKEFSAIYYAFNLDYLSKPFAKFLLNYPTLLKSLTCSTLYIEFYIPFLLFIPRFAKVLRLIVISIFIGLHISFILCLYLGLFPLISITAWLVLIPSLFWEKIFKLSTIKNLKVRINKLINKINYKLAIKVNNINYNLKPFLPAELMCSLFLYCIFILSTVQNF